MRWHAETAVHRSQLEKGIAVAAKAGASIVFLPELTLSRYPADTRPIGPADAGAEPLSNGPTYEFASTMAARYGVHVHASLFEKSGAEDGRGLNTAIVVAPNGHLVAVTRKLHIPVTEGYFEDKYFAPGSDAESYPIHSLNLGDSKLHVGLPTCWDEWFPEVPRCYALGGAELLAYPTAIGSEPDFPDFNTQPLLRQVILGHAIANGLFIVVPNRFGDEGRINFYGSSFIADPFGRVIAQAPADEEVALLAEIDLAQRQDWLTLFPFFGTRRPDTYAALTNPIVNPRTDAGRSADGGIAGIASAEQRAR